MAVAVVLYGPKAAGKSCVADALHARYEVVPVDTDEIVLRLLADDVRPDPRGGWLAQIEHAVRAASGVNPAVSVEATGAWDSDWQLAQDLEAAGVRVLRVWVCAPLQVTLQRLAHRTVRKVPTTSEEARAIYHASCAHALHRTFDLTLNTALLQPADFPDAFAPIGSQLSQ